MNNELNIQEIELDLIIWLLWASLEKSMNIEHVLNRECEIIIA